MAHAAQVQRMSPLDDQDTARGPGRRRGPPATSCSSAPATSAAPPPASGRGLPLGKKVLENVSRIVREEMDAIGGQEGPAAGPLLPKEPYEAQAAAGEEYGDLLFRLKDRKGADLPPSAPPHEEIFTLTVKDQCTSYKDLPVDPLPDPDQVPATRPARAPVCCGGPRVPDEGLVQLRPPPTRGWRKSYAQPPRGVPEDLRAPGAGLPHRLPPSPARWAAPPSEEFLAPAAAGEDTFVDCPGPCDYAANTEGRGRSRSKAVDGAAHGPVEELDTPETPTIELLAAHLKVPALRDAEEPPGQGRRRDRRDRACQVTAKSTSASSGEHLAPATVELVNRRGTSPTGPTWLRRLRRPAGTGREGVPLHRRPEGRPGHRPGSPGRQQAGHGTPKKRRRRP